MTIEELLLRTPNGVHNAYLFNLAVDYRTRDLQLDLKWWVVDLCSEVEEERERCQEGRVIVHGLQYLVIESPATVNGYEEPSYIDGFVTRPEDIERTSLPPISETAFRYSTFVGEWNSFIHFAGTSAEVTPADLLSARDKNAV